MAVNGDEQHFIRRHLLRNRLGAPSGGIAFFDMTLKVKTLDASKEA